MNESQTILGACVRALREARKLTLEQLAGLSGISYQYLSGVEKGKENFSIQVLERLAAALGTDVPKLVRAAWEALESTTAPRLLPSCFRTNVPLPEGLNITHLEEAANQTQAIVFGLNRQLRRDYGLALPDLIQGNNFSGLVSNLLAHCMDCCTPYRHNHDQRYPDLVNPDARNGAGEGLEIKTTVNVGKGGESHNGHSGWHLVACYRFLEGGDIAFVHLMFAELHGHQAMEPDWNYLGSKVNANTGSRRTETYTTNLYGTTKLRDGSVYLEDAFVQHAKWRQKRRLGVAPRWSIFYKP